MQPAAVLADFGSLLQGTNAHVVLEAKMSDQDHHTGPESTVTQPNTACWHRSSFWFKPLSHPLLLTCSREGSQGLPKLPQSPPTGVLRLQIQLDMAHPRLAFLGDHVARGQPILPTAVAIEVWSCLFDTVFDQGCPARVCHEACTCEC